MARRSQSRRHNSIDQATVRAAQITAEAATRAAETARQGVVQSAWLNRDGAVQAAMINRRGVLAAAAVAGSFAVLGIFVQQHYETERFRIGAEARTFEAGVLLSDVQSLRHQTAMSVINNIR